jgi:DNA-binding NarL/FixJ family response regulator
MGKQIRVLIADDHSKSRKGLRALLATCPAIEAIWEAENGREAARLVEERQPDVVLMDIQMPVWDGFEATRYIKARWPEVKVVALTIHAAWQPAAMSAGADTFLLKGCPSRDLFAAVQDGAQAALENEAEKPRIQVDALPQRAEPIRPARLATAFLGG